MVFLGGKEGLGMVFWEEKEVQKNGLKLTKTYFGYDINPAQTHFITGGNWASAFDLESSLWSPGPGQIK